MPMLTAAADTFDNRSQDYYDLPMYARDLCEAADGLRSAWQVLSNAETDSRREGRHDDAHDLRSPEQSAYLAWQAAELAYQQMIGRLVATRDAATGEITISAPESDQAEAERKRRANFAAVADGMAPPYPSEY